MFVWCSSGLVLVSVIVWSLAPVDLFWSLDFLCDFWHKFLCSLGDVKMIDCYLFLSLCWYDSSFFFGWCRNFFAETYFPTCSDLFWCGSCFLYWFWFFCFCTESLTVSGNLQWSVSVHHGFDFPRSQFSECFSRFHFRLWATFVASLKTSFIWL